MEAKRIVSENDSVFTFLVQLLDQKWSNAATKSYMGLLGPPTKFTTVRSVEPLRLRSQRRYLLLKTASFLSVSSQLLHRVNSGNYTMLPCMVNRETLLKIQLGFRVASNQIISDSYKI